MASSSRGSRGGIERVAAKLKTALENGQYYEAHQMYRTLYFRHQSQGNFTKLLDLLYDGALTLLQHSQLTSGSDVAMLFVDALTAAEKVPDEQIFVQLTSLLALMGRNTPERQSFVSKALNWSTARNPERRIGHPDLHKHFGHVLWKEKSLLEARFHFLHAADGHSLALLLIELHTHAGYPNELDLFLTNALLQLLCAHELDAGDTLLQMFCMSHPSVCSQGPPFPFPLLNMDWMLIQAIRKWGGDNKELNTANTAGLHAYLTLSDTYAPSLKRDSYIESLFRSVGRIYFLIPTPTTPQNQNPQWSQLLSSLFSAQDDSDTDIGVQEEDLD